MPWGELGYAQIDIGNPGRRPRAGAFGRLGRSALEPGRRRARGGAPGGPPPAGTYVVHAIDVGTGLAIFVEGNDFTLLYDAGSNDDSARGKDKDRVLAYLAKVRPDLKVIDHVILSHPHKDHVEMMDDVFETYEVRNVWDFGRP